MKRPPKAFKLMGHTITVQVIPRKKWTLENCVGLFDPATNSIYVLKQAKSQTLHTTWHEITHAMLHYMGHKLYSNEQFVDQIGGLIAQVLDTAE
jgi:hypothetical protein